MFLILSFLSRLSRFIIIAWVRSRINIAREFYTSFFSVLIQILYSSHLRLIFLSNFMIFIVLLYALYSIIKKTDCIIRRKALCMYLLLEIRTIRMSISNSPTAKITVKLLPASTKNLGSTIIFWHSSPETKLPWWTGQKKKQKKKLCSTTSAGKKLRSLFPLLPVFHWTKSGSSTSAICSYNSSAPNCGSTTSAEISVTITGLLTISMPSLRI